MVGGYANARRSGMSAVALFMIIVGALMVGMWGVLLATGQVLVPGSKQTPVEIAFHLGAEMTTAALLLLAGIAILRAHRLASLITAMALGLLLYSVLNSPGFYAARGDFSMVAMFAILTLLALACLWLVLTRFRSASEVGSPTPGGQF